MTGYAQKNDSFSQFGADLLDWYDRSGRILPWRFKQKGKTGHPEPYHVWLSEIMLQQTTVAAVKPYFENFISKWPTISDLARADLDDVLVAWAGLGYYARGRNLHAAARQIMQDYNGALPANYNALKKLKGVGDYTAAAVATIAFNQHAVVMDGNVERIVARLFYDKTPLPKAKKRFYDYAQYLFGLDLNHRYGDFAQALMDLGATVCIPKNPRCEICPVKACCAAYGKDDVGLLPFKIKEKDKPVKKARAFIIEDVKGRIYLRRRQEKGMLAKMTEVPTSPWVLQTDYSPENQPERPPEFFPMPPMGQGRLLKQEVRHSFTHFDFLIETVYTNLGIEISADGQNKQDRFYDIAELDNLALPSVMRKIINNFLKERTS